MLAVILLLFVFGVEYKLKPTWKKPMCVSLHTNKVNICINVYVCMTYVCIYLNIQFSSPP